MNEFFKNLWIAAMLTIAALIGAMSKGCADAYSRDPQHLQAP